MLAAAGSWHLRQVVTQDHDIGTTAGIRFDGRMISIPQAGPFAVANIAVFRLTTRQMAGRLAVL
ncbi:MAG: hypothetical protein PHQ14_11540 [Chromatiales bacterium]|jgi:hypothetical protein|nr:hypothetical protein [Chromatiales bacterium]MDX9766577.1 hypothetical protein [Ectothiorhodospiraceae bacterium]